MENLQGKTAFITGAASGIGLGIAKACGRAGMNVIIADIRRASIDEVLPFFEKRGWPAFGVELDVTDREGYVKAADEAQAKFGNIHVLVNNAGVEIPMGPLWESDYKDIDFITNVSWHGIINGIRTIVPRMIKHGEPSHVVSTASQSGMAVVRGATMYCGIKAGTAGLMETLATDLRGTNIGASVFVPGPVKSNLKQTSLEVRPDELRVDRSAAQAAPPPPPPPPRSGDAPKYDFDSVVIPAVEAGERVVNGIRRGDLYIFTHVEMRAGVKEKFDAILRAYPDEPINPSRDLVMREVFTFLMTNPIYSDQTQPPAPDWKDEMGIYED